MPPRKARSAEMIVAATSEAPEAKPATTASGQTKGEVWIDGVLVVSRPTGPGRLP